MATGFAHRLHSHSKTEQTAKTEGADHGPNGSLSPEEYKYYKSALLNGQEIRPPFRQEINSDYDSWEEEPERFQCQNGIGMSSQLHPIQEFDGESRSTLVLDETTEIPEQPDTENGDTQDIGSQAGAKGGDEEPLPLERDHARFYSRQHLQSLLGDFASLSEFEAFLHLYRPQSAPILRYYQEAMKVLRSMQYAKAHARRLTPVDQHPFTSEDVQHTLGFTWVLQAKADQALDVLLDQLPAFMSYSYIRVVEVALSERVTGIPDVLPKSYLDGLAEVFVLSDPGKEDNPIVFSSEEFHEMTGYSRKEFLGQNCRVLGGRRTHAAGIRRFKAAIETQQDFCEALLNYRKDGSPFINLIMCVPLRDQNGKLRYFLGAQLDVTDLLDSEYIPTSPHDPLLDEGSPAEANGGSKAMDGAAKTNEFDRLIESFDEEEMEKLVLFERRKDLLPEGTFPKKAAHHEENSPTIIGASLHHVKAADPGTPKSLNFYTKYFLVRPYPSLRILFTSPNFDTYDILQKPLTSLIGGKAVILDRLLLALKIGQKVTAKVELQYRPESKSKPTWLHCTPLLDVDSRLSVWVVILVEAEGKHMDKPVLSEATEPATNNFKEIDLIKRTPWELQQQAAAESPEANGNVASPPARNKSVRSKPVLPPTSSERSSEEHDTSANSQPVRKTYKSLSPYGVLFD